MMFAKFKNASHCDVSAVIFFLHQEIDRTFIHVCIKDYAGIDGRRDDLEVNYVAFGSNDI